MPSPISSANAVPTRLERFALIAAAVVGLWLLGTALYDLFGV